MSHNQHKQQPLTTTKGKKIEERKEGNTHKQEIAKQREA
jgi:hypothetical protein